MDTTHSLKCDFCSAPAGWVYPATDAFLPNGTVSVGDWCACDTCAALIEAGRRDELARRSAQTYTEMHGHPFSVEEFAEVQEEAFWAHRTADPRRPATMEVN